MCDKIYIPVILVDFNFPRFFATFANLNPLKRIRRN